MLYLCDIYESAKAELRGPPADLSFEQLRTRIFYPAPRIFIEDRLVAFLLKYGFATDSNMFGLCPTRSAFHPPKPPLFLADAQPISNMRYAALGTADTYYAHRPLRQLALYSTGYTPFSIVDINKLV